MKWCTVFLCLSAFGQVPIERIVNADKEPGNWLTYSRNLQGHRFSPLTEITPATINRLKVKWAYQFSDGNNEGSPIVADGVMYVSGPNSAAALDVRTGRKLWSWQRPVPADYRNIGFGKTTETRDMAHPWHRYQAATAARRSRPVLRRSE